MEADIIMMIAVCATVIVAIYQFARIVRTFAMHRTIREALLRGSVLTPELLARMDESAGPAKGGDDRTGLVLIAIALALVGFGILMNSQDNLRAMAGISLFPLFVGLVLFGRDRLNRRRGEPA